MRYQCTPELTDSIDFSQAILLFRRSYLAVSHIYERRVHSLNMVEMYVNNSDRTDTGKASLIHVLDALLVLVLLRKQAGRS